MWLPTVFSPLEDKLNFPTTAVGAAAKEELESVRGVGVELQGEGPPGGGVAR